MRRREWDCERVNLCVAEISEKIRVKEKGVRKREDEEFRDQAIEIE